MNKIRVRYAPSPTGKLHIGGARAALFNYLFAKKNNGAFILRIEDTDLERSKKEFEDDIFESLLWLGLKWDEESYRQSERTDIYERYIQKMLDEGKAYRCFCSAEDLEAQRQEQMSRGEAPRYNGRCSRLTEEEVGKPSVIRLRTGANKKIRFNDLIRGEIEVESDIIGDIVIAKDTKTPLYNLAVVIDDYEMQISHVIRGEDHIPNTPKQILIAEALGVEIPIFAHLPLVLGSDKSKMSKRHGSVSVTEYKEKGYLPEAIVNFMAFLGWNPKTDKEIYSMEELINDFRIENVQRSGAVFNIKKLDSINSYYIKERSVDEIANLALPYLINAGLNSPNQEYLEKVIKLHQPRLKTLSEIPELTDFFFKEEIEYDKELLRWKEMGDQELRSVLDKLEELLTNIDSWSEDKIEEVIMPFAEEKENRGEVLWPLRVALTGKSASAGPFEVADVLGKERSIKRIKLAQSKL